EAELDFETTPEAPEAGRLASAYLDAPVGRPIPLTSLNSPGSELDPFVTADGLAIWFAGDRAEGRGIYVATRSSAYHEFGPPELLLSTRSADVPATPSVSADGLLVIYGIAGKARLFALSRDNPLSEFSEKFILQFSRRPSLVWPSAQILSNGLRVYWMEQNG